MSKSYFELIQLSSYEDRFNYLKLSGKPGEDTFNMERYLNQILYSSPEWQRFRREIIKRDDGNDMGMEGYLIGGRIIVHHINPLTREDVRNRSDSLFDPNNVICVSHNTHNAIHFGDINLLPREPVERRPNDTCPWKT